MTYPYQERFKSKQVESEINGNQSLYEVVKLTVDFDNGKE